MPGYAHISTDLACQSFLTSGMFLYGSDFAKIEFGWDFDSNHFRNAELKRGCFDVGRGGEGSEMGQLGVGTIRRRANSTQAIQRGDTSAHRQ